MNKANPNYVLAGGLAAVALTLGAYILCEARGIDSGPVIAITGPVIAALLLQNSLSRVEAKTDQAVSNTNGALSGGIEEVVRRVYREEKALEAVAAEQADAARRRALEAQAGLAQTFPSAAAASDSRGN